MTFNFNVGDILNRGKFSNPNLACFIIEKNWDDHEGCLVYTIQHFVNGNTTSLLHDTIIALSYEG
jgi:hypothetical protein